MSQVRVLTKSEREGLLAILVPGSESPEAPHGKDRDGKILAPWGVKNDGTPKGAPGRKGGSTVAAAPRQRAAKKSTSTGETISVSDRILLDRWHALSSADRERLDEEIARLADAARAEREIEALTAKLEELKAKLAAAGKAPKTEKKK